MLVARGLLSLGEPQTRVRKLLELVIVTWPPSTFHQQWVVSPRPKGSHPGFPNIAGFPDPVTWPIWLIATPRPRLALPAGRPNGWSRTRGARAEPTERAAPARSVYGFAASMPGSGLGGASQRPWDFSGLRTLVLIARF
jgi:hypothetical protein